MGLETTTQLHRGIAAVHSVLHRIYTGEAGNDSPEFRVLAFYKLYHQLTGKLLSNYYGPVEELLPLLKTNEKLELLISSRSPAPLQISADDLLLLRRIQESPQGTLSKFEQLAIRLTAIQNDLGGLPELRREIDAVREQFGWHPAP
jgi:hypothetical protein